MASGAGLSSFDRHHMRRALSLAARGRGYVEPNPLVGCVIADGSRIVAEGWHRRFGDAHAEIDALREAGSIALETATMYVTLEPCCHHGKTPPCVDAILRSGIRRVVMAMLDPFPAVSGQGERSLRAAGLDLTVGVLEPESRWLNAPYLCRLDLGRPWLHAKWAMTLDGKIATRTGESRWISSGESRQETHRLRGMMDAILVGAGTVAHDDPALTARPPGPRIPTRVVLASTRESLAGSQLVRTAREAPVLIIHDGERQLPDEQAILDAGCDVLSIPELRTSEGLRVAMRALSARNMTHVLVEGGSQVLGAFFDAELIDELHCFLAPTLLGGDEATSAVGGGGVEFLRDAPTLDQPVVSKLGNDLYLTGRIRRPVATPRD